jgi:hypothetical protein
MSDRDPDSGEPEASQPDDNRYHRTPGDALRPDNNAPAGDYFKRPAARRTSTALVPAMPFQAAPAGQHPWERGPRENDRDWACFIAYRDSAYPQGLGGPYEARVIARTARDLGIPPNALAELARQHHWVWRAAHYDRDVDRRRIDLKRTEQERVHIHHARIRGKARQLAELELDKLLEQAVTSPGTCVMAPREVASLLKLVFTQDQLAAGLPTANDDKGKGADYGALDLAELKELRRIAAKAGGQIIIQTTGEDVTNTTH